jgi:hypothetical protein
LSLGWQWSDVLWSSALAPEVVNDGGGGSDKSTVSSACLQNVKMVLRLLTTALIACLFSDPRQSVVGHLSTWRCAGWAIAGRRCDAYDPSEWAAHSGVEQGHAGVNGAHRQRLESWRGIRQSLQAELGNALAGRVSTLPGCEDPDRDCTAPIIASGNRSRSERSSSAARSGQGPAAASLNPLIDCVPAKPSQPRSLEHTCPHPRPLGR